MRTNNEFKSKVYWIKVVYFTSLNVSLKNVIRNISGTQFSSVHNFNFKCSVPCLKYFNREAVVSGGAEESRVVSFTLWFAYLEYVLTLVRKAHGLTSGAI